MSGPSNFLVTGSPPITLDVSYQGCLRFGGPSGSMESIPCHRSSTIPDSAHPGSAQRHEFESGGSCRKHSWFNTSSGVREGWVLAPALFCLAIDCMIRQSWRYSRWSSVHRPQLRRRRGAIRTRSRKVAGRTQTFRRCCNHHRPAHLVGKDKTAESATVHLLNNQFPLTDILWRSLTSLSIWAAL